MALNENRLDVKPNACSSRISRKTRSTLRRSACWPSWRRGIGRWQDAETLLRRAVELAPAWTSAKANLALVLGRMGRPAEAIGAAR